MSGIDAGEFTYIIEIASKDKIVNCKDCFLRRKGDGPIEECVFGGVCPELGILESCPLQLLR